MSRMMTVEKELTTPFGIALYVEVGVSISSELDSHGSCIDLRCEDTGEEQDCLGVGKSYPHLFLVEGLILDTRLVSRDPFYGNKPLPVIKESGVGWRIGEEHPDDNRPDACSAAKLPINVSAKNWKWSRC